MPTTAIRLRLRQGVSALVIAGMLTGCVTTRAGRIGADDGTDSCRTQLVALDSTGNFFAEDMLRGAAVGAVGGALLGGILGEGRGALIGALAGAAVGAAGGYWVAVQRQVSDQAGMFARVQGDLAAENVQIDRTQLAFDQLMQCRFMQARMIREDVRAGRVGRAQAELQMATVRDRARRDIELGRTINTQIAGRVDQFEVAAESLAPGTKAANEARRNSANRAAVARTNVPVRLLPSSNAPDIGRLAPREPVTVTGQREGGYVAVTTASGARGFVPVAAVAPTDGGALRAAAPPPADTGDVRTLSAGNTLRRDNFTQAIEVASSAASTGFDLPT